MHQLTLMRNHLHLIATPRTNNCLSRLMKMPLQRYAQWRNQRRAASGRLYEERFWSDPLPAAIDLAGYTYYCDANAFSAGIVTAPEDHIWSTCAIHYGKPDGSSIPLSLWTPSPWYASLGDKAVTEYRAGMVRFLEGRVPEWRFERLVEIERRASLNYRRRIERPNGSSAR
jgi:hypothetical protein